LAELLAPWRRERPVVVGLPRGGVPVAAEVARALQAPLDVVVVRKLGHPQQPELGVGAIGEGGVTVVNWERATRLGVTSGDLHQVAARERAELDRRVVRYRGTRPRVAVEGRLVVLVDDGLATGFTARAAVEALRRSGARRVVLAVPVAPADTVDDLRAVADDVVCLATPPWFGSVGECYDDFRQVTDADVAQLLEEAASTVAAPPRDAVDLERDVEVIAGTRLAGTLSVPEQASGLVLFAHGSDSSRLSPRNRYVATVLNRAGIATLLFDLLTGEEAADRRNVFDVRLLGERLVAAGGWSRDHLVPGVGPMGYFGASTGAAAALLAAAELGPAISAVVSRGGRPDLALSRLGIVTAPTLLVVGGRDRAVLDLNRHAAARLVRCEHRLAVVPGATHLFEEAGALEAVATLATEWFTGHFARENGAPSHRASV
jgi:predicted phosphoribosyltransferase/predicted alpha/beta-hydrolase family hydrolase